MLHKGLKRLETDFDAWLSPPGGEIRWRNLMLVLVGAQDRSGTNAHGRKAIPEHQLAINTRPTGSGGAAGLALGGGLRSRLHARKFSSRRRPTSLWKRGRVCSGRRRHKEMLIRANEPLVDRL